MPFEGASWRRLFGVGWKGHGIEDLVELRPHVVPLGALDVAEGAFLAGPDLGGGRLGLVVVEVEVAPAVRGGEPLRVLHRDVSAVELAGEEAASGRLIRRPVGMI